MEERFNAWMPISKDSSGGFIGILSDNSLDRDNEFMTRELLESWAADSRPLPMLANHENKIEKLVGGWTNKQLVTKGDNTAFIAKPFFLKSNPLGRQFEEMVTEAEEKGLQVGISIAAIPHETIEKEIDGKVRTGYKSAEIVEATIVPIQSNRNATFMNLAKSFDIEITKNKSYTTEVTKMEEEAPKEEVKEEVPAEVPAEEAPVKEEAPVEEAKEEVDGQAEVDSVNSLKSRVVELEKQIKDMLSKAVMNNSPTVEKVPAVGDKVIDDSPLTVEKMIKLRLGGK